MKPFILIRVLTSISLVFCGASATASELSDKEDAVMRSQTFTLGGFHIDKPYLSMTGPKQRSRVNFNVAADEKTLWIKSFKTEIQDKQGKPAPLEYLCHAWASVPTVSSNDHTHAKREGLLTISQGLGQMRFPDGYALPTVVAKGQKIRLTVQMLNNNEEKIDKWFDVKETLQFLSDKDAKKLGMKPLYADTVQVVRADVLAADAKAQAKKEGKPEKSGEHEKAMDMEMDDAVADAGHPMDMKMDDASPSTGTRGHKMDMDMEDEDANGGETAVEEACANDPSHFEVPPGSHEYHTAIKLDKPFNRNAHIHFIKLHLHPFGQWMKLIDKTENKVLWTGNAVNDPKRKALLSTDDYSSTEGIRIYKNHAYEVAVLYNNPTTEPIDGMAVLRVYFGADEKP